MLQTSGNLPNLSVLLLRNISSGVFLFIPRAGTSCRNCLPVNLADKRQAAEKDAILAV